VMKRIVIKCTATNTRDFIYDEYTAIGLNIDPDIIEELDQLEADAELGRAVRKAFEKGYGMVDEEMFGFDSAEELIEWGRDCERY
jgi:phage tail tube protein FII